MTENQNNMKDPLWFCPFCFASEENGSWGHTVENQLCTNCGSNATVNLPRWAVASIRSSASWVGKRFYPNEEDYERQTERNALLSLVQTFPGRSVSKISDHSVDGLHFYEVNQLHPAGGSTSVMVTAKNEIEAFQKSTSLLYFPAERFVEPPPQAFILPPE